MKKNKKTVVISQLKWHVSDDKTRLFLLFALLQWWMFTLNMLSVSYHEVR